MAGHPFFGLWYPYSPSKDPWRNKSYADYRRYLYRQTASWLRSNAQAYKLDGIYVWTAGSWDALGVHYATRTPQGTWADQSIIDLVKAHNRAVNSG
jgi:hypothetical protein